MLDLSATGVEISSKRSQMERIQELIKGRRTIPIVAVLVLAVFVAVFLIRYHFTRPLATITEPVVLLVNPGSSLAAVGNRLEQLEVLESSRFFTLAGRAQGVADSIKTGEYLLDPGISIRDLLNLIVSGDSIQYRITFVEGWTFNQALQSMSEVDQIEHTLAETSSQDIARLLGLVHDSPEGMIHPDTYFFTRGTTDLELLQRARARQQELLASAWERRLGALPYDDPYEALIMASIVEKESGISSERGHIAGVFVRRLERGMRLQSDPTVIYGMGETYSGNIRRDDLNTTTPYNTYRINGLPPTPIALPGEESILASLNPIESDYLYFVATGDGGHYFSSTLEEHNEAVVRFQLQAEETVVNQ